MNESRCSREWPATAGEADLLPSYVLQSLQHVCKHQPDHDGPHTCHCGVVLEQVSIDA